MFRLVILSVLFSNISAKLNFYPHDFNDNGVRGNSDPVTETRIDFLSGEPLWVLSLAKDDWIAPQLRLGSAEEARDFFRYVGPMIIQAKRRQLAKAKEDNPDQPTTVPTSTTTQDPDNQTLKSNDDIQNNFLRLMNKYALLIRSEPNSYTDDNNFSSPSIVIYFKGPYTSLKVSLGRKQWHYYINIKNSLPDWFHEEHDTRDSPIQVPEDIKIKLFNSLFSLLHTMLGHPL